MIFNKKPSVLVDEAKIDEALSRSVDTIYPSRETLKKRLMSGDRLKFYIGIDPTATYVHIGHSTNYIILDRFRKLGHEVTALIGDFTAMIGDPSDKASARVRLTKEEVMRNMESFKTQISKILPFSNSSNPALIKFNSKWLATLTFADAVDLASNFTVQQMLERDVFEKRIKEKKPLYVHEFFYPLMQGFDSVAMNTDVEVGGTDQTFNMLAGRTLVDKVQNREKFVITTTLLENPVTGEKLMSKSKGTGIGLDLNSVEMYGKVMALPDETIKQCFVDCTHVSLEEIEEIEKKLSSGLNPKKAKMRLASEIVSIYHNAAETKSAEVQFQKTFSDGGVPDEIETLLVGPDEELSDALVREGLVSSKSELRRLVESGAIKDAGSGIKLNEKDMVKRDNIKLKIGKRRFSNINFT